ncbi:SRPBCC family protein [Robertkochia solimangrovi]|uniref:SRPBCC family protein n=1 Tax=Robertkochia solimangrovi TaxID=2213046 RepID=UPI001180F0A7|nr:SRPBCC domain-containing protein [Robertkochia solimangrovi]TRZ41848.1 hypothetical protein DMZ48_16010 [Robertkochia solimangrovi]
MAALSFERFTKRIFINTTIEKLYWCWATEDGITSWFLRASDFTRNGNRLKPNEFVQAGDEYCWMWHNWEGQETGKVLEANGKDKIVYTFAGDCHLTITLESKHDHTLLTLTQSNIPTDDDHKMKVHFGCSNGWSFWMANLKAFLEHNILLNETGIDLSTYDNYAFEFVNM